MNKHKGVIGFLYFFNSLLTNLYLGIYKLFADISTLQQNDRLVFNVQLLPVLNSIPYKIRGLFSVDVLGKVCTDTSRCILFQTESIAFSL